MTELSDNEYVLRHRYERMRKGFDPDLEIEECERSFTLDDLIRSLTKSTVEQPRTVRIEPDVGEVPLDVVVTSLTAVYEPVRNAKDAPVGYSNCPDWRFEGRILKKLMDPYPDVILLRGYVMAGNGELDGDVEIQRFPATSPGSS